MTSRKMMVLSGLTMLTAAVAALTLAQQNPARADSVLPGIAVTAMTGGDDIAHVGAKSCKKCHIKTFKSWEDLAHAKAFETLKPGVATEAKSKHNLDPDKDYTQDAECLACHATGFGKKGGYAIPDPEDKKAVREAEKFQGVGCEACHGAGEKYSELFSEIKKEKRQYTQEELYAVGLEKVGEQTCTKCHNDKSPTHEGEFKFEEAKEKGVHAHEELELRAG